MAHIISAGGGSLTSIGELAYGTSKDGVANLLEEIKSSLISTVAEQAADISRIETACKENWTGTSKEIFISNLKKDVTILQDGLNQMYGALVTEINAASAAILDFDQNLIKEN